MKIIYFISSSFRYETVIYPGVGPRFARPFGWQVEPIRSLPDVTCDAGIIDGRFTEEDFRQMDTFLAAPKRAFPIFFRLSDPDMPARRHDNNQYVLYKKDLPGVHYYSPYDLGGAVLEFVKSLKRSRVVHLPYPYDAARQIERDFHMRQRRVFLSGAQSRRLYPLRHGLHRKRRWNLLARFVVSELPHPGYSDAGQRPGHDLIHERYLEHAAGFTHFFLCPSRYRVELMKYVECAYAGCVPIGEPPGSLRDCARHCFLPYSGRTMELMTAVTTSRQEMADMAAEYRRTLRALREPSRLNASLEEQIRAIL
ncbi:MAG TPA: hypothetical protein VFV23_13865 [Verrucomicrobiae bacterium]|nr:hypothetical protein [Verrucomicrobiae bacterium]